MKANLTGHVTVVEMWSTLLSPAVQLPPSLALNPGTLQRHMLRQIYPTVGILT